MNNRQSHSVLRMLRCALLISFSLFSAHSVQGQVVINEVMQSNIDYLVVDNDYPDSWVEIYNPTSKAVDLSQWYFGEKRDYRKCWKLPSGSSVPAKGYFLIYCDKNATGVHTDFRIDAGNAKLFLYNKSGAPVDSVIIGEQPAPNIAYGRVTDGAEQWQYEFAPSAGKANYGPGATDILPNPVFSVKGGICTESFTLEITKPEGCPQEALIFYTTNGNEPVAGQAGVKGGMSHKVEITKNTVVRAKIVHPQYKMLSPRSVTESFIFHPREVSLPVISIVSDNSYFYDQQTGILSSTVNDGKPNYMQKWRRPINVEYYNKNNKEVFNQLGETAVSGVSTREQPQKSMKVYTNKRFGKKNFKGKFWEDKPEVTKVKSFVIRSGGNNSEGARVNDALVQKLFGKHVDSLDWQAYQPVIVYLNGIYLGEFGMRERSDENYVESNYDGLEDIEMSDEVLYQKPIQGSLFEQFFNLYRSKTSTYEQVTAQMQMDNFMNSLIAEIYAMNTDYPTNNVSLWRPLAEDGKWHWILKDLDRFGMQLGMYPLEFNMFNYLFSPDDLQFGGINNFDLYKKMDTFQEFRNRLVETFAVYLGDFLRPDYVTSVLDAMDAEIQDEVKATFSKYNLSYSNFNDATKWLKRAISERPGYLYKQMNLRYNLGGLVAMQVENDAEAEPMLNGIRLKEGNFDGKYFLEHNLHLTAADGYGWKMVVRTPGSADTETTFTDSDLTILLKDYVSSTTATVLLSTFQSGTDAVDAISSKQVQRDGKYLENNHIVIYHGGAKYDVTGVKKN